MSTDRAEKMNDIAGLNQAIAHLSDAYRAIGSAERSVGEDFRGVNDEPFAEMLQEKWRMIGDILGLLEQEAERAQDGLIAELEEVGND